MKINCIIIEDEPLAQKLLQDYISQVDFLNLLDTFNNPLEALPFMKKSEVHLVFLDIEMPKISGMDFLDVLEEKPEIIFTTAYSNYAVKSYEKNVLDYLLKPITFERFLTAVNKYPALSAEKFTIEESKNENYIFIKSDKNLIRLNYSDIYLIAGMKDYVVFYTGKEKHIVYHTLKKLEEILPEQFIRIHNSDIVNLEKINKIKDNHVYILDRSISIGNKYREKLLQNINKRII